MIADERAAPHGFVLPGHVMAAGWSSPGRQRRPPSSFRRGRLLPYASAEKAYRLLDEGGVGGEVVVTF
ncbi:hypothetical protein ACFYT4_20925 [Streptomyces sp. NPDC004609]|uniref:hypothetical protein n=1 Tax=Streptomyces sp. NPDC004609 TaxID=3364704 RepID=UPI0036A79E6C